MTYTVQEHAEWAGNHESLDQDFECDTLQEARELAAKIARGGSDYIIYDEDWNLIGEGQADAG